MGCTRMNLATAASLGMNLLQNGQGLGGALKGALGMTQLAKGQGFAQVAQKLGLSPQWGQQVGQAVSDLAQTVGNPGGTQVLNALQYFDTDKNGALSREELTQGLQKLQDLGLHQSGQSGAAGQWYQLGDRLLKQYERVAAQDGNSATLSFKDVGALMGKDGHQATLSKVDWQSLNL